MCFWDTKHAGICLQIVYEFPKFKCSLLWTYFVPRWDLWNLQTWRQHRAKKSLHMSLQFNLFRISKKIFAYFLLNCLKIYQNCGFPPLCECTSFTDGISGISRQSGNIGIGQRKPTASCPAGEHLYAFHALPQILSFYFTMISSLEICRVGGHCARFTCDSSDKLLELIFIHLDNIFGVREHLLNAHFPCASSDILLELISINCQTKEER